MSFDDCLAAPACRLPASDRRLRPAACCCCCCSAAAAWPGCPRPWPRRAAPRGSRAPGPAAPAGSCGPVTVQLLHELAPNRPSRAPEPRGRRVRPWCRAARSAGRRRGRTRCRPRRIGERRIDPAEGAEFPVRQVHRLGGVGHRAARSPAASGSPARSSLASARFLLVRAAKAPPRGRICASGGPLRPGGCPAGTRSRRARSR